MNELHIWHVRDEGVLNYFILAEDCAQARGILVSCRLSALQDSEYFELNSDPHFTKCDPALMQDTWLDDNRHMSPNAWPRVSVQARAEGCSTPQSMGWTTTTFNEDAHRLVIEDDSRLEDRSKRDDYHLRNIVLDRELWKRINQWHGGQYTLTYSLSSTGMDDFVSASMIDAAAEEMLRPGKFRRSGMLQEELEELVCEMWDLAHYPDENTAEYMGLTTDNSGYATWLMEQDIPLHPSPYLDVKSQREATRRPIGDSLLHRLSRKSRK